MAVKVERVSPRAGVARVVAVEGPVAAGGRLFLVAHRGGHIDAMGDAVAVGDDQRRSGVRVCLLEGVQGLQGVGPKRDLGDIDVAVVHGDHAQVFLADGLALRGELGHRGTRSGLGCLPAGVRVDLRVKHQHVDVPPRGEDVVQAAKPDVVSPAVAANDPDAPAHQRIGHGEKRLRLRGLERGQPFLELHHSPALLKNCLLGFLMRIEDRGGKAVAELRAELPEQAARQLLLLIDGQPHAQAELGIVLEE